YDLCQVYDITQFPLFERTYIHTLFSWSISLYCLALPPPLRKTPFSPENNSESTPDDPVTSLPLSSSARFGSAWFYCTTHPETVLPTMPTCTPKTTGIPLSVDNSAPSADCA